jgi:hypothetical protein
VALVAAAERGGRREQARGGEGEHEQQWAHAVQS